MSMKQTRLIKRAPEPAQPTAWLRTLETFNAACHDIAATAFFERCANKVELQKRVYCDVRQRFGLAAQMTVRALAKVVEACKRERKVQPPFRPHGAMTYDERICSFPRPDRVSLLPLDGREVMPFRFGRYPQARGDRGRGQADRL